MKIPIPTPVLTGSGSKGSQKRLRTGKHCATGPPQVRAGLYSKDDTSVTVRSAFSSSRGFSKTDLPGPRFQNQGLPVVRPAGYGFK